MFSFSGESSSVMSGSLEYLANPLLSPNHIISNQIIFRKMSFLLFMQKRACISY